MAVIWKRYYFHSFFENNVNKLKYNAECLHKKQHISTDNMTAV